jgi:hypothetical protein
MSGVPDSGAAILAREIAQELARVLQRGPESEGNDPKRLGDVQPALLNIDQACEIPRSHG